MLHDKENFGNLTKIFIYTHIFNNKRDIIMKSLSKIKHKFIIIFHNSDCVVDTTFLELLDKTMCEKIFAQNVCVINKQIQYLPIGIANSKWKHGDKDLLRKVINNDIKKENNIFFNFTIHTNFNKRNNCYKAYKDKIPFTNFNNQEKYLFELKKCKYCISPQGNGPDCHRIWECLYLDVIPVCKRSKFIENIEKDFPIYIVDEWEDLLINDELYNNYEYYIQQLDKKKLCFKYWNNKIIQMV